MTRMRITLAFSISDETMSDMLCTAGYGIGYWAEKLETLPDPQSTVLVIERDGDNGESFERKTNYAGLREAFVKLATPGQDYVGSTIHEYFTDAVRDRDEKTGEIDAGHIDSDAANAMVQVAIFDEVVY